MKKLVTLIALSGAVSALGQGDLALDTQTGTKPIAIYSDAAGTVLVNDTFKGQVFYGAKALGAETAFTAKGRFNAGVVTIGDVAPGGSAKGLTLSVKGPTAEGVSAAFNSNPLGGVDASGTPVPTPKLVGLQSFNLKPSGAGVIPEPSTIALGVLGAAALFFRSRK